MNNHTLYQQDFDSNNGDVSIVNGFINSHTLSQCYHSSTFNQMDGYVEKGDVGGGYFYMNSHTLYQPNGLK